jgi:hypothetical protein
MNVWYVVCAEVEFSEKRMGLALKWESR